MHLFDIKRRIHWRNFQFSLNILRLWHFNYLRLYVYLSVQHNNFVVRKITSSWLKLLTRYHIWGHLSSFSMVSILDGRLIIRSLLVRDFARCCSARRTLKSFISLWCISRCGSVDLFAMDRCSMWNQSSFICNNGNRSVWIARNVTAVFVISVRENDRPGPGCLSMFN